MDFPEFGYSESTKKLQGGGEEDCSAACCGKFVNQFTNSAPNSCTPVFGIIIRRPEEKDLIIPKGVLIMTENKTVLTWIEDMKKLLNPDHVMWIDGSEEQLDALRAEAVSTGEMIKLNEEKLPGCYLHRTRPNDVARVEDRTFICSRTKENAGPTNNWCDPKEM